MTHSSGHIILYGHALCAFLIVQLSLEFRKNLLEVFRATLKAFLGLTITNTPQAVMKDNIKEIICKKLTVFLPAKF